MKVQRAVVHGQIYRSGPFGGTVNTTLCGRMRSLTDGMNVGDEVTCKFCLRILGRAEREQRSTERT